MDDEQVAAFYAEKYGGRSKPQTFKDTEEVPQQLLLPSVNDPNLWMVKCKVNTAPRNRSSLVVLIALYCSLEKRRMSFSV